MRDSVDEEIFRKTTKYLISDRSSAARDRYSEHPEFTAEMSN
jgi:hypothetical protein